MQKYARKEYSGQFRAPLTHNGRQKKILISLYSVRREKTAKKGVFQASCNAIDDIFRDWKIIYAMLCMLKYAKKAN